MIDKKKIGNCILYQGDCLEVLGHIPQVAICIADPPYSSGGLHISSRRIDPIKKYVTQKYLHSFSGDNRDQRSFTLWAAFWMTKIFEIIEPGGYVFCFIDWRQLACISDAIQMAGFIYRGIITWDKGQCVRPNKGHFRAQCEFIVYGTKGPVGSKKILPGLYTCYAPAAQKREHPTQKPVEFLEFLMGIHEGIILDPFMGSGSTGVAAVKQGRNFIGIEKDAHWFEVAARRIEEACQQRALLDV